MGETDLISRQAAIDEMQEYWRSLNLRRRRIPLAAEAVYMDLKGVVATLPPAQPEITRCHECAKRRTLDCPMGITVFDAPDADGYCYKAERRNDG